CAENPQSTTNFYAHNWHSLLATLSSSFLLMQRYLLENTSQKWVSKLLTILIVMHSCSEVNPAASKISNMLPCNSTISKNIQNFKQSCTKGKVTLESSMNY